MSPYGTFDTVMENMRVQLTKSRYVLGDHMTAVDVLWAMGLRWGMMFGIVPDFEEFKAYTEGYFQRPAPRKVLEEDQVLAAEQDEAAVLVGIACTTGKLSCFPRYTAVFD